MNAAEETIHTITEYLVAGGLFNPEMMDHDKVRDLLMKCREVIESQNAAASRWVEVNFKEVQRLIEIEEGKTQQETAYEATLREVEGNLTEAQQRNREMMNFIHSQFSYLVMNRETGPEGEACTLCGEFVGEWGRPECHAENCELRKLL